MSRRINQRVDNQSNKIHGLAFDIPRVEDHINQELAQLDWHPADTMNAEGTIKGGHASPAEQVAVALNEGVEYRTRVNQWITDLEDHTQKGRDLFDETLRWRTARSTPFDPEDHGTRCRHADCTNWASPHYIHNPTDGTRTEIADWCDQHWVTTACRAHGDHPHEHRRIDGLLVCQAAYRRHQRDITKDVA